jgi:hypothetical protein
MASAKTRILDPRPKLLKSHMPGLATGPYIPNKEVMVKAEKGLFHGLGHAVGRGRVNTQLIFSHL